LLLSNVFAEAAKKASELAMATVLDSSDAPDTKVAKLTELLRASVHALLDLQCFAWTKTNVTMCVGVYVSDRSCE
jgi:hypothetical protein